MSTSPGGGAPPSDYRSGGPSDYSGEEPKKQTCETKRNDESHTGSYAAATQGMIFPKRDQVIVVHALEGYTVRGHVSEIVKITSPTNIRFISRISNGRICIYLASKIIAEDLIEKKKTENSTRRH